MNDTHRNRGSPVDAIGIPINARVVTNVQIIHFDSLSIDNIVRGNHQSNHRPQKDGITGQDLQKGGCGGQQLPGIDNRGKQRGDVGASPDVDKGWKRCGKVKAARQSISRNVDSPLRDDHGHAGKEASSTRPGASVMHHGNHQVRQTPDWPAIASLCCGSDEDSDDGADDGVRGGGSELTVPSTSGPASESSIVGLIEDTSGDSSNGTDDGITDGPACGAVLDIGVAGDDATKPIHGGEGPDQYNKEEDKNAGDADPQQLLELVRSDVDQGKGDDGKDDIGHESGGGEARGMNVVWDALLEIGPDGFKTDIDTAATDPRLNRVPDQRQKDSVIDDERTAVHAPDISVEHGEAQMVVGPGQRVEDDEAGRDDGADNDGDNGLPPGKAQSDHRTAHHISGDVGVCQDP